MQQAVERCDLDGDGGLARDVEGPRAHAGASQQVGRTQRRLGERILEEFIDGGGLAHRLAVGDEHRHHAVRVERQERLAHLVEVAQRQVVAAPFQSFFGQHDADLLGAQRRRGVVEFELHGDLPHMIDTPPSTMTDVPVMNEASREASHRIG